MSDRLRIVEVSPRDGLQSEPRILPVALKLELINRLVAAGLREIEVTAFVRPERLPQLADADELASLLKPSGTARYSALVPNKQGLERAARTGIEHIAFFTAASESFCQKNIGCSIGQSLLRCQALHDQFRQQASGRFRAYISCAFGCPYEGRMDTQRVVDVAVKLAELGSDEIVLADTMGVASPLMTRQLVKSVAEHVPVGQLALHLHDTRGQALANIYSCLDLGIAAVDASVAGLGGCPYAPGATGNLATEDLVYLLEGCGVATGVDLECLIETGRFISEQVQRPNQSRVGIAGVPF
jgi:hydroxymethylglutaryl-CoA lyase